MACSGAERRARPVGPRPAPRALGDPSGHRWDDDRWPVEKRTGAINPGSRADAEGSTNYELDLHEPTRARQSYHWSPTRPRTPHHECHT